MGTTSALGRLQPVDLRTIWTSEATGFTPWLAQPENLALLGEAIGAELSAEGTEMRVGPFRADILCKEVVNGRYVLIENQIERTDHTHLGQLLTYAAGLSAVTIVWIAQRFTDEHRAALDWLNEVTGEDIAFFGLEIQLWKIGDSPAAPKFNVVSQPNAFVKSKVAERQQADDPTTAMYRAYWSAFCDYLEDNNYPLNRKNSGTSWAAWGLGKSNVGINTVVYRSKKVIGVRMSLWGPPAKDRYEQLKPYHEDLKSALPELVFEERPNHVESYFGMYLENADIDNQEDWPRQFKWMADRLVQLKGVFEPYVRRLV